MYNSELLNELIGQTLVEVDRELDALHFYTEGGKHYVFQHPQTCCEDVYIEDVIGDLNDLVGSPLVMAEEVTSRDHPDGFNLEYEPESCLWTFYKFATTKGYVDVRWFGSSNGNYSEAVKLSIVDA